MTLPTVSFLQELKRKCDEAVEAAGGERPTLTTMDKVLNFCSRNGGEVLQTAIGSGLKSGVTHMATAAGVSSGVAIPGTSVPLVMTGGVVFIPLGAVLAPWIGAATIAYKADSIFQLHDLNDMAKGRRQGLSCTCGNCSANIEYAVGKKETVVARTAIGIFTAGISELGFRTASIVKSFEKNRPKERHARSLTESGRNGCNVALATILNLVGGEGKKAIRQATTVLVCEDGWSRLKKYM